MMGAFNGNPRIESAFDRDRRSPWNNPPINGEADNLVDRFSEIAIRSEPPKDTLFQVMDAVLSAESTIRIQVRVFVSSHLVFVMLFQWLRFFDSV